MQTGDLYQNIDDKGILKFLRREQKKRSVTTKKRITTKEPFNLVFVWEGGIKDGLILEIEEEYWETKLKNNNFVLWKEK